MIPQGSHRIRNGGERRTDIDDPLIVFCGNMRNSLIRQFMLSIPKTYDEAAYLDGAGRFQIFWKIMLPMTKPAIIVAAVLWFLRSWNDFFYPFIFLSTWEKMTLPVGLTVLAGLGTRANPVSVMLAGVTLSLIPPVLIFIFGQKYLVEGTALSGIKG